MADLDRTQPIFGVTTLEQGLAATIAPRRFNLKLFGTFAASALPVRALATPSDDNP